MSTIVISEFMDEAAVDRLAKAHETLYDPTLVDRPDALNAVAASASALIVRNRTQVRPPLLDACPNLIAVGRLGVGLDNIDLEACNARNISVYPATGANTLSVAEYVITTTLMLFRGAYLASSEVAAGTWPRTRLIGRETSGATMGLIGFGGIAREVAVRAKALGMSVMAHDPFLPADDPLWSGVTPATADQVLSEADAVSLHIPLTPDTRNLIDAAAIAKMKPNAILINTARGGVIDEVALAKALVSGHLAGVALDVFETEPLDAQTGARFQDIPNVILTPHIAGVTAQANSRVSHLTADTILKHLAG